MLQLQRETEAGGLQKGLVMKGTARPALGPPTLLPTKSWCGHPLGAPGTPGLVPGGPSGDLESRSHVPSLDPSSPPAAPAAGLRSLERHGRNPRRMRRIPRELGATFTPHRGPPGPPSPLSPAVLGLGLPFRGRCALGGRIPAELGAASPPLHRFSPLNAEQMARALQSVMSLSCLKSN